MSFSSEEASHGRRTDGNGARAVFVWDKVARGVAAADNPSLVYQQIACPAELEAKSGLSG